MSVSCSMIPEQSTKRRKVEDECQIDKSLAMVMKPHQTEAVNFILDRLLSYDTSTDKYNLPHTGAVLADEMGTGKTLVGICSVWSICKYRSCKAVIVCPPMLVDNWRKEIKKWLPSLGQSALFVSGSAKENDYTVNLFVTSHATVRPVLVIGYEMFRSYAEALNTVNSLEILLCDEGHRLKNSQGTKTSTPLTNCIATRRIVLTGTPIQNNLEELYAVMEFALPGFLGTLNEFKANYSDPITAGRSASASEGERRKGAESEAILRNKLANVILRRTKESVLTKSLPPRREFVMFCALTATQQTRYMQRSVQLLKGDGFVATNDAELLTNNVVLEEKEGKQRVATSGVLPHLMALRLCCNSSYSAPETDELHNTLSSNGAVDSIPVPNAAIKAERLQLMFEHSSKLKVLDELVASIQLHPSPSLSATGSLSGTSSCTTDKIVVVSNFTSTLDAIAALGKQRRWKFLRIDGSVLPEHRTKRIELFNNPTSNFNIMLLSAKAGGVGINLVGGNRLVMFDPDWNPATDQQAMGRVWREGQIKPVFIYRLISQSTVEQSILTRQTGKAGLSVVIQESGQQEQSSEKEFTITNTEQFSGKLLGSHLTLAGLHELVLPAVSSSEETNSHQESLRRSCVVDNVLFAVCFDGEERKSSSLDILTIK